MYDCLFHPAGISFLLLLVVHTIINDNCAFLRSNSYEIELVQKSKIVMYKGPQLQNKISDQNKLYKRLLLNRTMNNWNIILSDIWTWLIHGNNIVGIVVNEVLEFFTI